MISEMTSAPPAACIACVVGKRLLCVKPSEIAQDRTEIGDECAVRADGRRGVNPTGWFATTGSPWPTPFERVPTSPGRASGRLREQGCLPPRITACGSPWPTPQRRVPTSPGRSQWPTPRNWVPTSPDHSLLPSMPQRVNSCGQHSACPKRCTLRYQARRNPP